jgi:hypothetical protein
LSTAKFDTLSTLDGSRSVPVSTVAQGTARAWVNFNGTGTVAIRAAFNVTSITDNGTGSYTLNFTTAFADANYAANSTNTTTTGSVSTSIQSPTTTTLGVISYLSTSAADQPIVCVSVFR